MAGATATLRCILAPVHRLSVADVQSGQGNVHDMARKQVYLASSFLGPHVARVVGNVVAEFSYAADRWHHRLLR